MGARSSWRPPWLDSVMPSTPRSASFLASARFCTPLTTTLPGHWSLIQARSSKVTVGSNMVSSSSATVPLQRSRLANASGSVVRKLIHHSGRGRALRTVPAVSAGGIEKPLRLSRRRAPATGTSTVTSSVSKPAAAARSTRAIERSRSFHMYNWNQLRPSGLAALTSSIAVVPMVDRENGMPARAAAWAPAISPSVCIIRVKPVGAMPNGRATGAPSTSHPVETVDTSRRIDG
jgi:hypothetical protein